MIEEYVSPKPFSALLDIEGWSQLDPILLAALATDAPLLLIGPHGTGKTLLVERLAKAMNNKTKPEINTSKAIHHKCPEHMTKP